MKPSIPLRAARKFLARAIPLLSSCVFLFTRTHLFMIGQVRGDVRWRTGRLTHAGWVLPWMLVSPPRHLRGNLAHGVNSEITRAAAADCWRARRRGYLRSHMNEYLHKPIESLSDLKQCLTNCIARSGCLTISHRYHGWGFGEAVFLASLPARWRPRVNYLATKVIIYIGGGFTRQS